MNWLTPLMGAVSALLTVYMLLLVVRIVLTWVSMDHGHQAVRILQAITDPYLEWFRRFRFLVFGAIDFSPVAAILVINFLADLTRRVAMEGQISVGIVLSILVQLVWGAVAFLLLLVGLLALARYLGIRFRWGGPMLWTMIDSILQPPAYALGRKLKPGTFLSYTTTLVLLAVVTLGSWLVGSLLFGVAAGLLHALPL